MKIADGMRNIADNIIASHQVRAKALGNLVSEVSESLADARKMIKNDAADRKAMSKEQAAELARFAGNLANSMGAKLKGFQKELELVAKDRALSAKELKGHLRAEARGLRNLVKKNLSDYSKDHAEMSEAQRHNLHGYVNGIVKAVGDLTTVTHGMMSGYRSDIRKAGNIWGSMTNTIAKAGGKKAALPVIRAKEDVGTVLASAKPGKEAVRKVQKRKKRKK